MSEQYSGINPYPYLKQIPIFKKLNWFELKRLAGKSRIVEYRNGDMICHQGDAPGYFYCLVSGRVEAFSGDEQGQRKRVEFIVRGMHFGIISTLTGEPHSLSFRALNDSMLLQIPVDDFREILKSCPKFGAEVSQSLSRRIRTSRMRDKSIFESTIISVYSPVTGAGSSTYAANLAIVLKEQTNKEVILVHIASRKHEDSASGVSLQDEIAPLWKAEAPSLAELVNDQGRLSGSIVKEGVPVALLNVVCDPQDQDEVQRISQFVTSLVDDYHFVLVDLPNHLDDVVLKTLIESDLVQIILTSREQDVLKGRGVIEKIQGEIKDKFDNDKLQVIVANHPQVQEMSYHEFNQQLGYDVAMKMPLINARDLAGQIQCGCLTMKIVARDCPYRQGLVKIARNIGNVLVGLVLGGGAALGIAHIGVLKVLEEEKIPVDIVVGSSMGALLGSMWVTGKSVQKIEDTAHEFEKKVSLFKLIDLIVPISGFIGGRAVERWLKKQLGNKIFYNTKVPFKVVAYDLARREEIVINSGLLVSAVRKSISIPGVFKPVTEGERVIIDGGVLNPLPTNVLSTLGIKKIIAVNVLQSPEDIVKGQEIAQRIIREAKQEPFWRAPLKYLGLRLHLFMTRLFAPSISDIMVNSLMASEYVIAQQSGQQADVVIHPDLVGINWFELYKVDEIIRKGEEATRQLLPEIKKLIED